jgi:hypothetical protein
MNGKTAKLLRKYSGHSTDSKGPSEARLRYRENKRRWSATPRTLRNALRVGAKDKLAETL